MSYGRRPAVQNEWREKFAAIPLRKKAVLSGTYQELAVKKYLRGTSQ
jgi:hypothetical protein